jgi:hypothetical protein
MESRTFISLPTPPNFTELPPAKLQILLSKAYINKSAEELKQRPAQERISIASSLITNLVGTNDPAIQKARHIIEEAQTELSATSPFPFTGTLPKSSPIGATPDRINAFPKNIVVGGKKRTRRLKKKSRRRA